MEASPHAANEQAYMPPVKEVPVVVEVTDKELQQIVQQREDEPGMIGVPKEFRDAE